MVAPVCSVVGCLVILRQMAFLGNALSHTGICLNKASMVGTGHPVTTKAGHGRRRRSIIRCQNRMAAGFMGSEVEYVALAGST
jgi:hypothetical protein